LFKNYSIKFLLVSFLKEIKRKFWTELIKGSYAQNYEDLKIENIFPKDFVGSYLEIGAYHPTRLSNTYRFYKKGWRGTIVEPNPEVENIFKKIRPDDTFLGMGISDKNENLKYYKFLIPALNTFSKNEADKNISNGHKLEKIVEIQTKNIKEIVDRNIDFLSIDTEGFDELILKSWPWNRCKPKVICVESKGKFKLKGYKKIMKTENNTIFGFQQ
jgi:FkbM family methyltransferase